MLMSLLILMAAQSLSDPLPDYNRKDWGRWIDADKDCQNTRQEVLIAESLVPVIFKTSKNCTVISGFWIDPFTGKYFTKPSKLDIDHMVPLRNVHQSGGAHWTKDKKRLYSNNLGNPDHLIAVSASANRSKGARSPDQWLPVSPEYRCQYIDDWVNVKQRWELSLSVAEKWALGYMRILCKLGITPPLPNKM